MGLKPRPLGRSRGIKGSRAKLLTSENQKLRHLTTAAQKKKIKTQNIEIKIKLKVLRFYLVVG